MAKKKHATEAAGEAVQTFAQAELPEVELPELSGFGLFPQPDGKFLVVRVTNYGVVEQLSPRGPESKHSATARLMEAVKLHVVNARRP